MIPPLLRATLMNDFGTLWAEDGPPGRRMLMKDLLESEAGDKSYRESSLATALRFEEIALHGHFSETGCELSEADWADVVARASERAVQS